jgi:photosystem II stability/assembly factor-like uncharacterized protein
MALPAPVPGGTAPAFDAQPQRIMSRPPVRDASLPVHRPAVIAWRGTPGGARLRRWIGAGLVGALAAVSLPAGPPAAAWASRTLLLDARVVDRSIVAVGAHGRILRTADTGASWEAALAPVPATLTGVCFVDAQRGWAVGHEAIILSTEDGGRTWARQYQGADLQVSFLDVCFLDPQNGFAVGAYGTFLATADGGKTWTERKILEEDCHLNRITLAPDGVLYIAGERGTLLRSADRGATWVPIPAPYKGSFFGILPLGPRQLLVCGLRGSLFRSDDTGDTWQAVPNDVRVLLATAVRLRSGVIVVAGQARAFLVSRDDGRTFQPWSPGLTTGVAELVEAADGTLLAFGEAGASRLPAP